MLYPVTPGSCILAISILLNIIRVENQGSHLDTLSGTLGLGLCVYKRAVRYSPGPPILLRIKTLNKQRLLGCLLPQVEPAMIRIWPNRTSLPNTIRVDQRHGQKVVIWHRRSIGDSEWVFANCLDGTPNVDDLITAFEKALGFVGEVVLDALRTGFVRLVNVDALNGAAEGLGGVGWILVRGRAADGVVEDEDFGGAGAGRTVSESSVMVERKGEKKR